MAATINSRSVLSNADLKTLERESWIDHVTAENFGLYRVNSVEGAQLVGRDNREDYSGIVFPVYFPGKATPRECFLRRDHPPLEHTSSSKLKPKGKYLGPPGRRNYLLFGPDESHNALTDKNLPIILVEGLKKLCAAWRFSRHSSERQCFLACALCGVWGWRGTTGKTPDAKGTRVDIKGVIPDFDRVTWKDRDVIVIFDSDAQTNQSVAIARNRLVQELRHRGARVTAPDLPGLEGLEKTGFDDLLAQWGPGPVMDLFKTTGDADPQKNIGADGGTPKSQATLIIEMAEAAISARKLELFHAPDQEIYVSVVIADHWETWALKSKMFRTWIAQQFFETHGKAVGSRGLQDALNFFEAKARFAGSERTVFTRIAGENGQIFLDLGNERWEAVVIDSTGWRLTATPPVKFVRARGALSLSSPAVHGELNALRELLNVDDHAWTLIIAWLLAALRPKGPYPVLVIHGEQGSGKSWLVRVLRSIIDPNTAPLRAEPRDGRDLMIAARNGWVVALDNLSHLAPWLSDCLCRLSTGGGFSTRELYSDYDEVLFDAQRPIVLNGIEELATRGDLLDRALIVYLPRISEEQRASEAELTERLESLRPQILGALLEVVVSALRVLPSIRLSRLPRLADFAIWIAAAESALGWQSGTFMRIYEENRSTTDSLALEASAVAPIIVEMLPDDTPWEGTASELLACLEERAGVATTKRQGWPASPRALGGQLRRLAPILRAVGVDVSFVRDTGNRARRRLIILKRNCNSPSGPSGSSSSVYDTENQGFSDGRSENHSSHSKASQHANRPEVSPHTYHDLPRKSDEADGADETMQPHSNSGLYEGDGTEEVSLVD
jgi:hypothetical protein